MLDKLQGSENNYENIKNEFDQANQTRNRLDQLLEDHKQENCIPFHYVYLKF